MNYAHNKALHRTAIPLRSIAAGELDRYRFISLFNFIFKMFILLLWKWLLL